MICQEHRYVLERFTFKNKGQRLIATIMSPAEPETPPPGVLLLHGFPGVAPVMNDLMLTISQSGFASMIFHYRGSWGSGGQYSFLGALDDALKAVSILSSREDVDNRNLAVIGHSFGGLAAIHVAAVESSLKAAAALCPVASMEEDLTETDRDAILKRGLSFVSGLTAARAKEQWRILARRYDPVQHVDKLSPRPLLLIHGDTDDIIPLDCSKRLFSKAQEPKELFIVNDGDHLFSGKHQAVKEKIVSWLRPALSLEAINPKETR
ncbi:MAG: alpha/beta fold hydrolase [Candidatus Bathyarchaeia archaeon]